MKHILKKRSFQPLCLNRVVSEPQLKYPAITTAYTPVPSELYINVWQFMAEFIISWQLWEKKRFIKKVSNPEKTIIQKASCTTMFIAALFTIARTHKQNFIFKISYL